MTGVTRWIKYYGAPPNPFIGETRKARLIRYSHPTLCLSRTGSEWPFLAIERHMIVPHEIAICNWGNNWIPAQRQGMSVHYYPLHCIVLPRRGQRAILL